MNSTSITAFDAAVKTHLRVNCNPPVPSIYLDAAIDAIADGKDNDYGRLVHLPNGQIKKAGELIVAWNLQGFVLEDYND